MGCIYKITNLVNNKIYIGFTTKSKEDRWKRHISSMNNKKYASSLLYKAIKKYGKENFKIEELLSGNYSKNELSELEKQYIKNLNSFSINGYNLNEGGQGGNMYIRTKEIKEKISKTLLGHSYNKGIPKTSDHKIKLKEANLKLIENGYRLPFCKYVYQYDLKGNFINRFNTVTEAAKFFNISKNKLLNISNEIDYHPEFRFKISKEELNGQ